nr:hypothetical protein [uncultured Desulfobulbus sp.]
MSASDAENREKVQFNHTYAHNGIRRRKTKNKIVDPAVFMLSVTDPKFITWLEDKIANGIKPTRLLEYCLLETWRDGRFDDLCKTLGRKVRS